MRYFRSFQVWQHVIIPPVERRTDTLIRVQKAATPTFPQSAIYFPTKKN